ncbi:MAG TPA: hypothetical protein VMT18_12580, partial [Planctomycetota bacterium]|nr:hypothetical protein [Planctomycetota bacterium]
MVQARLVLRALPALFLALLVSGCLSVNWTRSTNAERLDPRWTELQPGSSTLEDALELLGAPLYVYEYAVRGAVLVWGRGRADDKGFNVSVQLTDQGGSADFDYSRRSAALRGVLLAFDPDWRLVLVREGLLSDLTAGS